MCDSNAAQRISVSRLVANLLACATIALVFALMLRPAINNASATNGEIFPSDPENFRRIDTGLGVSILQPRNWSVHENTLMERHQHPNSFEFFFMRPNQCLARREGSTLSVRRNATKPQFSTSSSQQRTFHGRPAWEHFFIDSHNALDYIPTFQLIVQDGDTWWTISFSTTSTMDTIPNGPRSYVESIRFDSDAKIGG